MAITFRGQGSRLNKDTKKSNQVGFQDKSSSSDRQGVGGEDVSLSQAMSSFSKRNSSPAKSNCSPITSRAKSSPFKINQTLIDGARDTGKQFLDAGAIVRGILNDTSSEEAEAVDLSEEN